MVSWERALEETSDISAAETASRSTRAIHLPLQDLDGTAINDLLEVVDARPHQPAALSDGRPGTAPTPATRSHWSARFLVGGSPATNRQVQTLMSLCCRVAAQGLFGLKTW
ncbi:hypothetical protein MGG_16922 [Pyricularia oryzae 70-15]|uniref:Uncharacterized protein n=3 Tax=Pyricularia oryzae TaxID=318829 RepID=G4N0N4_PYRO7|nr:uncharacterized protein MGG_16922 [Pyricularia oryzae 70-15]EHA53165.1 hypothetical protein MGG_16922 [Pyricularia oryzae 70-15]ELQ44346.1 hypothetical protein OOU_Y34scaffold00090g11 [Pyricularia oryzae Y34]